MAILVTGAGGYLASALINHLIWEDDKEIIGLDNNWKNTCDTLIPFVTNERFSFVLGDITDPDVIKKIYDHNQIDNVVHMAAIVGAPACKKYKMLSTLVNVVGTENVIEHKPKETRLVYCNTGSIYKCAGETCTEESEVGPQSHYGMTKLAAEKIVLSAENTISHRYATAMGLSTNNMRVNLLMNDLVYQAVTNKSLTLFEANFMRTFIHCRDIASAIYFTMSHFNEMLAKQRVYNVGNNKLNYTKKQLAELIQKQTGCYINYAETEKDPDQRDYGYDSSSIYHFGWKPEVDIEPTITELIQAVPLLTSWDKYK